MEKQYEFECGCTVSFDCVELDGDRVCFEFSVWYCEQHDTVEAFVSSDWLRFDLKVLPDVEALSDE